MIRVYYISIQGIQNCGIATTNFRKNEQKGESEVCVCESRRGERHRGKCEVLLYRGHGGGGGRVIGWRLKASSSSRGDKSLDRSKKGVSSSPPLILLNKFWYIAPTYSLICINFHWFLCITIFLWGAKTLGCWFKAVCKTFEDHGYAKIVWDTSDFFFSSLFLFVFVICNQPPPFVQTSENEWIPIRGFELKMINPNLMFVFVLIF